MTIKKNDKVAEIITSRIIEQLEQGLIPWRKPWIAGGAAWSRSTGKAYGLINQMLLRLPGEYATFNQIKNEGGQVLKGAKSDIVLEFWITEHTLKDENGDAVLDDDGNEKTRRFWHKRYARVFHVETCTTLAPKYEGRKRFDGEPIELAEQCFNHYVKAQGIDVIHKDLNRAYYSPGFDHINLPELDQFKCVNEYYSTAFHEAAHSTGHETRLNRLSSPAAFGSNDYGKEELVAELTSAAVMSTLGLELPETFENSAAYIQNWTNAIKGGKADIIGASTQADKAMNMILDGFEFEPGQGPEPGKVPELFTITRTMTAPACPAPEVPEALALNAEALAFATPGKLTKAEYFITVHGDKKGDVKANKVAGYITVIAGVGVGVAKGSRCWTATDLLTGFAISCPENTRAGALAKAAEVIQKHADDLAKGRAKCASAVQKAAASVAA